MDYGSDFDHILSLLHSARPIVVDFQGDENFENLVYESTKNDPLIQMPRSMVATPKVKNVSVPVKFQLIAIKLYGGFDGVVWYLNFFDVFQNRITMTFKESYDPNRRRHPNLHQKVFSFRSVLFASGVNAANCT